MVGEGVTQVEVEGLELSSIHFRGSPKDRVIPIDSSCSDNDASVEWCDCYAFRGSLEDQRDNGPRGVGRNQ